MPKAKKRGRPKGSRNKQSIFNYSPSDEVEMGKLKTAQAWINANHSGIEPREIARKAINDWKKLTQSINAPTKPPSYLLRLEAATLKYEQAINDAITALKGN